MQIGSHSHNHGAAQYQLSERAQMMQRDMSADNPTKGDRAVARLDKDDDGAISIAELKDTKFGRRISADRFAQMDSNSDGRLEGGEIDAGRRRGGDNGRGPATMESVVTANYADYLTEKVDTEASPPDVASLLMQALDNDQSGGLNSEEIAGTRLAQMIDSDFYQIDADRDGALNKEELSGFVADRLSGRDQETGIEPGDVAESPVAPAVGVDADIAASDVDDVSTDADTTAIETADVAGADVAQSAPSVAATRSQGIASAFEAALEILKSGSGGTNPYDVVNSLYADVQKMLQTG